MSTISPWTRQKIGEESARAWNQRFQPQFRDLVGMGAVEGASALSYGCTVTSLSTADGTVALYEAKLAYPTELSGSTCYLVSSSASDTGQFTIQGLDATGAYATAVVTATGTTPAAIPGTWNHIQRCISNGAVNVGTVYVSTDSGAIPTTTGDQIQTVMLAGVNYAINPLLICPSNQVILINRFDFSIDVQSAACRIDIEANRQGRWLQNFVFYSDRQFTQTFDVPLRLQEGEKLRVKILAGSGTNNRAAYGMNGKVMTNSGVDERYAGAWQLFS